MREPHAHTVHRHWLALACLMPAMLLVPPAQAESVSQSRQAELRRLLLQDCGSCHGMRLSGGLGPPLTARSLSGKSRNYLVEAVREGRPGTPMPPWKYVLSEADIGWLVDYLLASRVSR